MKTFQGYRLAPLFLLLVGSTSCVAQAWPKTPATWWPDSTTGLMWTGTPLGYPQVSFVNASSMCENLVLDGYSKWRIPTMQEYEGVSKPVTAYGTVLNTHPGHPRAQATVETNYSDVGQLQNLKFVTVADGLWTSTPGAPGDFLIWNQWNEAPSHKPDFTEDSLLTFCVRPMEPELLDIAKEAHPSTPVSGMAVLKALVILGKSEDAMAAGSFQEAVDDAKQVLLIYPKHEQGLEDLALAYSYMGQWDQAIQTLQTAEGYTKKYPPFVSQMKWTLAAQKEAATDPNATTAWALIYRADAAQHNKQYEDAVAAANQVIQMEPNWPEGYQRLGNALGGLDQWSDAVIALTKAKNLDKHGTTTAKADLKNAENIEKHESKK